MKKILTFALVAFAFAFCACSNDDDSYANEDKIVGYWEAYKMIVDANGKGKVELEIGENTDTRVLFEFRNDKTCIINNMEYYDGRWNTYSETYNYSVKGNILHIPGDDDYTIKKLTSKELVLMEVQEEGSVTVYMKRI